MSSIFTKIINGELPSYKIYEDEFCIAILDINPMNPGHTLVISKREVDSLFDLMPDEYVGMMEGVKYVANVIKAKLEPVRIGVAVDGYNVPHAHIHVLPTYNPHELDERRAKKATDEELKGMQDKLLC